MEKRVGPSRPTARKNRVVVQRLYRSMKEGRDGKLEVGRKPSTSISPSPAMVCAVSNRLVVDLPAPFGPSSPTQVPTGTSTSSPSTAMISP